MADPLTHPSLRSTGSLTASLGAVHTLLLFVLCLTIAALSGEIPINQPEAWIFIGVLVLIFPVPGVTLICSVNPIRRASKVGVTVALVVCAILTVLYGLVMLQNLLAIYMFYRLSGGIAPIGVFVSLLIAMTLLGGFIVNIVKLSRCYGVINEVRHGGRRGFAPVMAVGETEGPSDSPPGEWPEITD
jgi:hypothetical protein